MPEPGVLRLMVADRQCVVSWGRSVLFCYDADDIGMRNLAIVALTDAKRRVNEVAEVFGLTPTYVSILRGRASKEGSAGLVRRRGRPPKLSVRDCTQACRWSEQGRSQEWIAERFGVARSVIGRVLAERAPVAVTPELDLAESDTDTDTGGADGPGTGEDGEAGEDADTDTTGADSAAGCARDDGFAAAESPVDTVAPEVNSSGAGVVAGGGGSARITEGVRECRYAGVLLAHAYLDRVGAQQIFATVTGGPARRYDDLAVLSAATLGFALGMDTVEGAKHLRRTDAGAAVGLEMIPQLRTLRTRLCALADGCDPLALQRAFAAGMLAADPPGSPVYYVDDHFTAYAGKRPVAKGYNTRRRLAEPGHADTVVCDARGRAVLFASGEPSGLTRTMPTILGQLREVTGPDAPILLGFDRGGAYPAAFTACKDAGMDWLTYRRAPLVATTAAVHRCWSVREGRDVSVDLADEIIELSGYGDARQLTLVEHDAPVLQVLTSDTTASGAALLDWLRARWRIENLFKYAAAHHGINTLADYTMDLTTNTAKVANPARKAARTKVAAAATALAAAERAVAQTLRGPGTPKAKNTAMPGIHKAIEAATRDLAAAQAELAPIPAKLPANELDPQAQRARPRLERRGLQMVLRLLAFNAEAWLAEHLNAYLADPNNYRAITRNLLHQGGIITYHPRRITVTLHRTDTPRITRALEQLTHELNADPPHIPGDSRPIHYEIST